MSELGEGESESGAKVPIFLFWGDSAADLRKRSNGTKFALRNFTEVVSKAHTNAFCDWFMASSFPR